MFSVPTRIAPACFSRATAAASWVAGGLSALIFDPARVVIPPTSNKFLTAKGTPAKGPGFSLRAIALSIISAAAIALSAVMAVKQLSVLSRSAIRSKAAVTTALAVILPLLTADAVATASAPAKNWASSAFICVHLPTSAVKNQG